jgi:two-component sensor histidine kinase
VLEVDSRSEGEFSEHDIAFLQGAANILGMAIERQRNERQLRMALDRQQVLLNEINHRVKNSLQIVAAMLQLQANAADDGLTRAHLIEASGRVSAIGRAYERLSHDANVESINLGPYLQQVCADAVGAYRCILHFDAAPGIELDPDRAISLALIVNELVTNAVKHALSDRSNGHIWVRLSRQDENSALISVRDDGVGLPAGFDLTQSRGLGMRIIAALAKQLGASITQHGGVDGTEFALLLPLERRSES